MTGGNQPESLLGLLERMIEIREFEGRRASLPRRRHAGDDPSMSGQEATAVGVCAALERDDLITSTFRGHGHAFGQGLGMQPVLDESGATTGCCKEKVRSMHMGDMAHACCPARYRRRRHPARRRHGAGPQDAELAAGGRLFLRRRRGGGRRLPRGS